MTKLCDRCGQDLAADKFLLWNDDIEAWDAIFLCDHCIKKLKRWMNETEYRSKAKVKVYKKKFRLF